jgi:hypothetical protein
MIPARNVYAVIDDSLSPTSPVGDAIEGFLRRENAERFIEEVRGDDPELGSYLRISRSASWRRRTELAARVDLRREDRARKVEGLH